MPVAYASRALTETEKRYAQIEKEMLAIVFSLEKFHHYTYGRQVTVFSDHKPLEMIFKKPLAAIPRRLQGMRMRLPTYDIEVIYQPGPTMHIADLLSRSYLPTTPDPGSVDIEHINIAQFLSISDERLSEIKAETAADETLQLLKETILRGWTDNKQHVPSKVYLYFSTRDELSIQDGLIDIQLCVLTHPSQCYWTAWVYEIVIVNLANIFKMLIFNFTLHSIQGRITFTEDANSIVRKLKTNERLPNPVGRDARTSRPFTHDFLKPKASSTESES